MEEQRRTLLTGYGTFDIRRPNETSIQVTTRVEALDQELGLWITFDEDSLLWRVHDESREHHASLTRAVDAVTRTLHDSARQMRSKARETERERRIRELDEYLERLPLKQEEN